MPKQTRRKRSGVLDKKTKAELVQIATKRFGLLKSHANKLSHQDLANILRKPLKASKKSKPKPKKKTRKRKTEYDLECVEICEIKKKSSKKKGKKPTKKPSKKPSRKRVVKKVQPEPVVQKVQQEDVQKIADGKKDLLKTFDLKTIGLTLATISKMKFEEIKNVLNEKIVQLQEHLQKVEEHISQKVEEKKKKIDVDVELDLTPLSTPTLTPKTSPEPSSQLPSPPSSVPSSPKTSPEISSAPPSPSSSVPSSPKTSPEVSQPPSPPSSVPSSPKTSPEVSQPPSPPSSVPSSPKTSPVITPKVSPSSIDLKPIKTSPVQTSTPIQIPAAEDSLTKMNRIFGKGKWSILANHDKETGGKYPQLLRVLLPIAGLCRLFNEMNIDVNIEHDKDYDKNGYPTTFSKSKDAVYIQYEDAKKSQSFEVPMNLVKSKTAKEYVSLLN